MSALASSRRDARPAGARPVAGRASPWRAVLAAALAVPGLALAPPATAVPGTGLPAGTVPDGIHRASVVEDDRSDPARPVRIDVTRLEPRTLTPGAPVTVVGTLTNTGTETLTGLGMRLQRGEVLGSRAELLAAVEDPDPTTAAAAALQPVPGELEPGDSLAFTYTAGTGELRIDGDGVYPALLHVSATTSEGEQLRVGELSTYLLQPPALPALPTAVAWLWPLVERTHRNADGAFVDDGLAEEVAAGGRLDRALAAVERLPVTGTPEGPTPIPAARVTLAVDPALVEELALMARGPYAVVGLEDPGEGTEDAAAFLDRLRAVAADHPVVALPYGDVDADALTAAGLTEVLTRSLPGTPEGTVQDGRGGGADGTSGAEDTQGTAGADADAAAPGAGAGILRDVLGVQPRTDLAWAVGGTVREETLATLQRGGIDEVVLAPGGVSDGAEALGLDGGGAAAGTSVGAPDGPMQALVADTGLSGVVAAAGQSPGGARIAEQRYLAELALLALRPPASSPSGQSVLIAPPREVDADPDGVSAMISATAQLPWLRPVTVEQLRDGPVADAGELVEPADPGGLEAAGLADVAEGLIVRNDLAGAVVGDPDLALAPYDAAASRATSAAWRDDPEAFRAVAADLRATLAGLRNQVTLLAPADGTYSLASSDAPLVLTVRNDLPFAVRVQLHVQSRGNVALSVADIGPQDLAPEQRTTLQVPTEVRQSGRFGVVATLTTPGGSALGQPIFLQVKSTAYGAISLIITIGAAALLGLLFLRRLVLFVLRRRRRTPQDEPTGAPDGTSMPVPPTRSPV